ncbi:MAG: T9SS type A sorting domain-containing protein [Bacteroidetes bacterium]|nr:T9SS type A sorting domain-containing protein [Bacteroidota bacterium]
MRLLTSKKLLAYSSVACMVALNNNVNANLIYTDVVPDSTLQIGDQFVLDLDANGVADFKFRMTTFNPYSTSYYNGNGGTWAAVWPYGNDIVGYIYTWYTAYGYYYLNGGYQYASVFNAGSSVTSGMDFANLYQGNTQIYPGSYSVGLFYIVSFYIGSLYNGPWVNQTDKYVGVRFDIDGSYHYGWVQISTAPDNLSYTIQAYAYEDDNTIRRAKMEEPTSLDDRRRSDVTIYSFKNDVHIRGGKGIASIYTLSGKMVHKSKLTGNTSISLDRGIYLVRVMDNGSSVTKKVYLH